MQVNGERLWADLMSLGQIGAGQAGGHDRQALCDADGDARRLFMHWCRQAGLSLTVDAMGNIFARREGTDPSLPPVLAGSHLDTQATGGRFDGPLGVLGALEAVRTLNDAGIATRRAIEVVNWTNEEGCRFFPGLMGSAVFTGALALEQAHAATDRAGRRFGEELRRIGFLGEAPMGGRPVDTYLELHIEQGPLLERVGVTIGAVTQSCWSAMLDVAVTGQNSHIQSTPMPQRRNALYGAALLIAAVERCGYAHAPDGTASTVVIDAWPNNRIVLPHLVTLSFGLVCETEATRTAMLAEIDAAMARIGAETGLGFETRLRRLRDPFHFDAALVAATEQAAQALGHSVMRMRTRPGHDAFNMSTVCPTELIFVPCRDGLSHNEAEWCEPVHCAAGASVLAAVMLERANR
ncbi:allantoate amidohydrolase [Siccirubricoccus phaeus]|uniref:allantoate amidohydrolase n=1 Tax=Siccirubricoccus phaeus TaxID=2595053 RepID=UPI0011F2014A|nr:allantoate amidohydrolase [Siccirubricoccus phaeus]